MVYESLVFHIHVVSMLLSPLKQSSITEMIILRSTVDNPLPPRNYQLSKSIVHGTKFDDIAVM